MLYFLLFAIQGWVKDVRDNGGDVKIVPRLLFEGWSVTDYMNLFADQEAMIEVAEYITHKVEVCLHVFVKIDLASIGLGEWHYI